MADVPVQRTCGTMEVHRRLLNTDPAYVAARLAIENRAFLYRAGALTQRTGVATIPVVVHVVYNTAEQNISTAQIASQIAVLNRDYRGSGTGTSVMPPPFANLVADSHIEFKLAATDPQGAPTNGITRRLTAITAFSTDDSVKFAARGGADAWPSDRYLNLWVCSLAGGVLGYSQLPGGPGATDGVVIYFGAFGTMGTATAPFHLGRTATHEIGHWLNLLHIWGDDGTGCNGEDFVADTPNQAGPNFGVPSFPHVTCSNGPGGDLFVNFMDYTDDACMQMFTTGQVTRMNAALDGPRASVIGAAPAPMPTPGPSPSPQPTPGPSPQPTPSPQPASSVGLDLLFYDRAAGAADLYVFDGEGNPSLLEHYDSWRMNWDIVAPGDFDGGSKLELFFYNRQSGDAELYSADAQMTFSLIGASSWGPNWDAVVGGALTGAGERDVLFYARATGDAELHRVDAEGHLSLLRDYSGWRTSWDAVVAGDVMGNGLRQILFYDRAAGEAELYAMDAGGYFSLLQRFDDLGTNWDVAVIGNLTGGSGSHLLLYDRHAGDAVLATLDGDGHVSVLCRYSGWETSWDVIVAGDLSSSGDRMKATMISRVLSRLRAASPDVTM